MNVPSTTWVMVSRMKLRSMRGPNCDEAMARTRSQCLKICTHDVVASSTRMSSAAEMQIADAILLPLRIAWFRDHSLSRLRGRGDAASGPAGPSPLRARAHPAGGCG